MHMITIEQLNAFGADTAEGIERCCGSEALYLRLAAMIPAEKNFALLEQAVAANDLDAAFEAAHALKGVLGNLSLTPMFEQASRMTELLRARTPADYATMTAALLAQRDALAALCND